MFIMLLRNSLASVLKGSCVCLEEVELRCLQEQPDKWEWRNSSGTLKLKVLMCQGIYKLFYAGFITPPPPFFFFLKMSLTNLPHTEEISYISKIVLPRDCIFIYFLYWYIHVSSKAPSNISGLLVSWQWMAVFCFQNKAFTSFCALCQQLSDSFLWRL